MCGGERGSLSERTPLRCICGMFHTREPATGAFCRMFCTVCTIRTHKYIRVGLNMATNSPSSVCVCVSRCKRYALKGTQPDSPQNAAGFPPMLRNGKRGKTSQASGKTLKVSVHSRQNTNGLKVELHIFAYIRLTGKGRLRSS